jgi:hypothetical protein
MTKKKITNYKDNLSWLITSEYIKLYSIRNKYWFINKLDKYIKKSQLNRNEWERYKTFISRSVSDQQKADLLYNNPIFDYIPLTDKSRKQVYALKENWKYWWKIDETDKKIYDVVSDAADWGSWFLYQGWKVETREVKYPKFNIVTKQLDFEVKNLEQYNWIYSEYIRIEDIFFDWVNIEDSNIAIWRKFRNRTDFINRHKDNSLYKNINETDILTLDLFLAWNPKLPQFNNIDSNEDLLLELRYYNIAEDKLIITANWVIVQDIPIPHLHKELPFCKYDNFIYRNRLIQLGNYELLEDAEEYLDKIRQQTIDVTKANIWFNIVEKDSDFDPELHKVWVWDFLELENSDSIKHFSANIQANWLTQLQQYWQDDIITLSWTDYRSQLLQSWETATKTSSKNQAQLKRINLILKRNSFNFYNRLAKLRLADLQLINQFSDTIVPLRGWHINSKWDYIKIQDWYWLFTIKQGSLDWKFNIVLQTESLLWNSTEKEKENYLNFFQIFGNLVWEDKKRIINATKMVEIAGQKIWVDTDLLLEKESINKSWADTIWEIINSRNWLGSIWNQSNNPDYIPPQNRANDSWGVNVLGWGNTAI